MQLFVEKASELSIAHEIAQQDASTGINEALPQHTHPDPQLGQIGNLFERWDRAVETQKELMRWINGVKIEREREEGSRVCDEVASGWEDLGEVYGEKGVGMFWVRARWGGGV